jgi:hypothetical protein
MSIAFDGRLHLPREASWLDPDYVQKAADALAIYAVREVAQRVPPLPRKSSPAKRGRGTAEGGGGRAMARTLGVPVGLVGRCGHVRPDPPPRSGGGTASRRPHLLLAD